MIGTWVDRCMIEINLRQTAVIDHPQSPYLLIRKSACQVVVVVHIFNAALGRQKQADLCENGASQTPLHRVLGQAGLHGEALHQ